MWYYLYAGLFILGTVLAGFAYWNYKKSKDLQRLGIKTDATVVELIAVQSSDDNGYTYKPVFQFSDKYGETHTFKSQVSSRPPAYKVGETVKVIYNPLDVSEVKTVTYWGLYRWSVFLMCIAAPLLIIGGGYLLYHRG